METKLSPLRTAYLRKGGRQPFPSCLPAETRSVFFLDQDFRATRSETGFLFFISALLACGNVLLDRKRNIILLHFRATSCRNAIVFLFAYLLRFVDYVRALQGRRLTHVKTPCIPEIFFDQRDRHTLTNLKDISICRSRT